MQDQHSSTVYLIGYRASGKTSAGRALAARLCRDFVDTDHLVEAEAGREIAAIFEESGEEAFRHLEIVPWVRGSPSIRLLNSITRDVEC